MCSLYKIHFVDQLYEATQPSDQFPHIALDIFQDRKRYFLKYIEALKQLDQERLD